MSAADYPDCKEFLEETNRLRSEVERLQYNNAELLKQKDGIDKDFFGTVCFERDEALAQVAVLVGVLTKVANDKRSMEWWAEVDLTLNALPTQARALFDRLQRAEAAVGALRTILSCQDQSGWQTAKGKGHDLERGFRLGRQALAAWEEGK